MEGRVLPPGGGEAFHYFIERIFSWDGWQIMLSSISCNESSIVVFNHNLYDPFNHNL